MTNIKLTHRTALRLMTCCLLAAPLPLMTTQYAQAAVSNVDQSEVIQGSVVDANGDPVINATVVIASQSGVGTITDFDGNFQIKAKPGTKLRISYIGMKTVEVPAKQGMKVVLQDDSNMLQGVEVVAYGTQKKVTVTGALSSVKSEDLVRTPVGSVNNVLGGQISGVTTVQYSGEPGSDAAEIFVRGQGTWADASPLIQVDGVERSMSDIDPNEIESITVLKDASATAVFGVRGANGVVLITTKRGQEGKAKINFSTSFSALTPTKMVDQADSYGYATFHNLMNDMDGTPRQFSDQILQKFQSGSDPIRFPSMQWADYIMKDVTLQSQHNMTISGGTKKVRYFISAGMYTVGGLFKEFDMDYDYGYQYQRFNYRTNLDLDVTRTTTLSINVARTVDEADKPYTSQGSSGMIKNIYYATPFSSAGIVDGKKVNSATDYADLTLPFTGSNPFAYYGAGFSQTSNNKLQMDLQLKQKLDFITKGLSWKIKGSYNTAFTISKTGSSSVASYTPVLQDDGSILYRKSGETTIPSYSTSSNSSRNWYFETALNYSREFGDHTIGGLLLYNQSRSYYPSTYSAIPHGYVGIVGRVTYDYKNRYMAEFNIGYNGSENFAPDKRFGTFPAFSAGWIVSDETFFKPIIKVVNFMKLRGSIGLVGNDKVGGDRFMYTPDSYIVNNGAVGTSAYTGSTPAGYNFGTTNSGNTQRGSLEASKHNPDVTWETALKRDLGVDLHFLDGRLKANFDYYWEHRKDLLLRAADTPGIIGFTVPYTNQGETKSWGYEVTLNWNDKIGKEFRYWVKANLSYNQSEIIERKEQTYNNEYQYQRGNRIGANYLYKFWGLYYPGCEADYEKEMGHPFPKQTLVNEECGLRPGDAVYVDMDGNGVVDANDQVRGLGYTNDPEYMAGLSLGFNYKGFSFNAQLTAAWNVNRLISDVFRQPFLSNQSVTQGGLLQYHIDNSWTTENQDLDAEYPRPTWKNANQNYASSDLYLKDSKYLRLKTIQVAYDFKFPFMKKLGMNQLQLALSGYNLLTFTPYLWGDPEARASSAPSYPLQRTYTASLKIGF